MSIDKNFLKRIRNFNIEDKEEKLNKSKTSHFKQWPTSIDILKYNIMPMAGHSCDIMGENGTKCNENFVFTNIKNKHTDCTKYCLNHANNWIVSLFKNRYDIYDEKQNILESNISINLIEMEMEIEIQEKIKVIYKTTDNFYYSINCYKNYCRILISKDLNELNKNINEADVNTNNLLYEILKNETSIIQFLFLNISYNNQKYPGIRNIIVKYHDNNKISKNWTISLSGKNIMKEIYNIEFHGPYFFNPENNTQNNDEESDYESMENDN